MKSQVLQKLLSPVLYASGHYARAWRARHRRQPFALVLMYHRVVADTQPAEQSFDFEYGVSASSFERQMRFLRRHFVPARATEIRTHPGDSIRFAVTFDDGYEDNFRIAAPILRKLGIPATFFVVSDFVGSREMFWWERLAEAFRRTGRAQLDLREALPRALHRDVTLPVLPLHGRRQRESAYHLLCAEIRGVPPSEIPACVEQASSHLDIPVADLERDSALMDWEQLRTLAEQGFEIGGHSATHASLVGADDSLLQREVIDSNRAIEARLGMPVRSFAYPYGLFDAGDVRLETALAAAGVSTAFTAARGVVDSAATAYELPRLAFYRPHGFACAYNVQRAVSRAESGGRD